MAGSVEHCPFLSSWCVKESGLAGFDLDTQALASSVVEVDGGDLAGVSVNFVGSKISLLVW